MMLSALPTPSEFVLRLQDSAPEPFGPRRASRPVLDRATGLIEFAPGTGAGLATELGAFLVTDGIRVSVADEEPPFPEIQLLGVSDLDRVAARIAKWQGLPARPVASPSRSGWPGRAGQVSAIDQATGVVTIAAGAGEFTIVDMLADRRLDVGDELAWDEPNGVGVAVYQNRTKGTRLKVFVESHRTPASQLSLAQRGW